VATALFVVTSAVALGLLLHSLTDVPVGIALAAGPLLVLVGCIVTRGARVCLAALVIADLLGLYQEQLDAGGIGVRVIDVFWLALVVWALVTRRREGVPSRARIGQPQLALWLMALGASLYPVVVLGWGDFSDPLIAWLRLVQTFSLVWLVPYALRKDGDLEYMMGAIELGLGLEIVRAIADAAMSGGLSDRLQGGVGANTEGLLGALLVVAAVHAPVPRSRGLRGCMLVLGIAALLLSRSLGATAAVAATLGIFGLRSVGGRSAGSRAGLLTPARVLLLVVAALAVAATFRPENLPNSSTYERSSTTQRVILARAGLELFADKPFTGVGWGRAPAELASGAAAESGIFANVNPNLLPGDKGTNVHNAYVEILAESGLVGMLCFLALVFAAARGIRAALRAVRPDAQRYAMAIATLAMLIAVLIWWNDNALFGAQPETVLAATLLGMLSVAGVARPDQPRPATPLESDQAT
jgi:O-antigen ligase